MFGWRAEEVVGGPLRVLMPERFHALHLAGLERARRTGRSELAGRAVELVGLRRDGGEFPVELSLGMWESSQGTRFSGVIRDITQRHRVEEALRASEEQFRGLVEAAPDAMVIVDAQGRISLVNRQTERLFGYQREELLGQPVELLVPERLQAQHRRHRGSYLADPGVRPMDAGLQLHGRRKDGSEVQGEISLSPLQTDQGTLVSAAVRDTTGRQRAEQALREREATLRVVISASPDLITILGPDGRIRSASSALQRILGVAPDDVVGRNALEPQTIHPDDQEGLRPGAAGRALGPGL